MSFISLDHHVALRYQGIFLRFAYDGLKRQRITEPYVKAKDGFLRPEIWENALVAVARVNLSLFILSNYFIQYT